MRLANWFAIFALLILVPGSESALAVDPLPSWRDGAPKKAILAFVGKVAKKGALGFAPIPERIAVFDKYGTLWPEQPLYFQLLFAIDRVKYLAPQHPEWAATQPFKAILENDHKALAEVGEKDLLELVMATHAGMSTDEFESIVRDWIGTAKHPKFQRPYTDLAYQPMLELLAYLRANGFKTYIVSGGGIEFMRPWVERVYGIPAEQVLGSSIKTRFEYREGKPALVRLPEVDFLDDKAYKPVAINKFIGRRPVAAFGNFDGDLQMLQWTCSAPGTRFCLLAHHDDVEREWAYDRQSSVGRLDQAWDEAVRQGWTVVNMKQDWIRVFPFQATR